MKNPFLKFLMSFVLTIDSCNSRPVVVLTINSCNSRPVFFRPVVVCFEEIDAREEVLQKAGMLKGSNVFITEDLSRFII